MLSCEISLSSTDSNREAFRTNDDDEDRPDPAPTPAEPIPTDDEDHPDR